jgi:hypothetical protein
MSENVIPYTTRQDIIKAEEMLLQLPNAFTGDNPSCPLEHTFVDGAYVRQISMPKGMLISSKIHKKTHPYFILSGDVSVVTEQGLVRMKAPFYGITKAGTKRILYTHEDTVWVTVHVTEETDLDKIEEEVIAKSFSDLPKELQQEIEESTFELIGKE